MDWEAFLAGSEMVFLDTSDIAMWPRLTYWQRRRLKLGRGRPLGTGRDLWPVATIAVAMIEPDPDMTERRAVHLAVQRMWRDLRPLTGEVLGWVEKDPDLSMEEAVGRLHDSWRRQRANRHTVATTEDQLRKFVRRHYDHIAARLQEKPIEDRFVPPPWTKWEWFRRSG